MYFFTFVFNMFYYGFRDLLKRERWKLRRHDLGRWDITLCDSCHYEDCWCTRKTFVPYMLRWIIQTPFGGVRLQKITASDRERYLHDHPFDFITFRLWNDSRTGLGGGYFEERPDVVQIMENRGGQTTYPFGMNIRAKYHPSWSMGFRRATDLHRLNLMWEENEMGRREIPQWTLFFHGPNLRDWGFQTEEGWVQWEVYEKAHGLYEANNP
jgi:hypothetical protein